MINSRSFRNRQRRKEEAARIKPITHTEIMRRKGTNRSLSAPGDIKKYKGGTRVPIETNSAYKVYSFNMPGSNGSGEYKVTSGCQTIIILNGVLFVRRSNKSGTDNIVVRSGDFISFAKGDVVSFSPNTAPMDGILIESGEVKTKKSSDPIINEDGISVYQNTRVDRRAKQQAPERRRREKTAAEREAYGQAYMAARGVPQSQEAVYANAAGQVTTRPQKPVQVDETVATVVEGENPQPMGDKGE